MLAPGRDSSRARVTNETEEPNPLQITDALARLQRNKIRLTLGYSTKGTIRLSGTARKGSPVTKPKSWSLYFAPGSLTAEAFEAAVRTIDGKMVP
jgi:hypothetical protein